MQLTLIQLRFGQELMTPAFKRRHLVTESIGSVNQIPLAQIQYFDVEITYNICSKNRESKRGYESHLYYSVFDGNGANQ